MGGARKNGWADISPAEPQQMTRRFAGDGGKLVEMLKPEFTLETRRRSPRGILFSEDFYKDRSTDFDAELLTPGEQKFAAVYDDVLAKKKLDGHHGAALVDWIAAMLVRTDLVKFLMPTVPDDLLEEIVTHLAELKKLVDNMARSQWFTMYQDFLVREKWNWKWCRFSLEAGEIIITDHPVCTTSVMSDGEFMVVVLLSRDTVLYGGGDEAIERMRHARVSDLNFFLAAWARRHIFVSTTETLERVRNSMSERSEYAAETVAEARKPLFGVSERIRERMAVGEVPNDFDFGRALQEMHEGYGRPRWEAAKGVIQMRRQY